MISHIENRTHRRLALELSAGVAVISRVWDRLIWRPQFQCVTQDVSVRGMKVMADRPIQEGVAVKVWVTLPDDVKPRALELRGRVCWATSQSEAGQYLAGISLDTRPERPVAVWADTIRQRVRAHFRNIIPAGATPVEQNFQGLST